MNILESPYYRMNKFFLTCLGQWPYQNTLQKRLITMACACVKISIAVPEVLRLIEVWGEVDYVLESISVLIFELMNCITLTNYIFNADTIKDLMFCIQRDWDSDIFKPQLQILKGYAAEGKKLTKIYSAYMCTTVATFMVVPVMPKFLDILMPLNESRPNSYPLPLRYGNIDPDKYYVAIMFHTSMTSIILTATIIAMDTTYTVYVQHACGIFAALGNRVQLLMETNEHEMPDEVSEKEQEEHTYRFIIECVKIHKKAIDFAQTIEYSHVIVFFFLLGLNISATSMAAIQMVMNLDKPIEVVRFALIMVAQLFRLFFMSWPGQKLIDHSVGIREFVYGTGWYEASPRAKKLLMLMMMRSFKPCHLTAGKLYVMCLENFSTVVQTSMTYCTVLASFR